jgi:hypothetical protein
VIAGSSWAATQRSIASISSDSIGETLPTVLSVNSISRPSAVSPSTSCSRSSAVSSPSPGGTRQSIFRYARDGITLILSDAWAIVGVSVTPSIGSSSTSSSGACAAMFANAPDGSDGSSPSRSSSAAGASVRSGEGWRAASRSSTGPSFSNALSPIRGSDACPAAPRAVTLKRKIPFSPQHTP